MWLTIGASERTVNQSVIYWLLHGPLSHAENHELSTGAADVLHVELSLAIRPRVRGEDCAGLLERGPASSRRTTTRRRALLPGGVLRSCSSALRGAATHRAT